MNLKVENVLFQEVRKFLMSKKRLFICHIFGASYGHQLDLDPSISLFGFDSTFSIRLDDESRVRTLLRQYLLNTLFLTRL